MSAPYDWAKDPGALVPMVVAALPPREGRWYPNRLLVPAVRLQRCDDLKRPFAWGYQMRSVQLRWRPLEWSDLKTLFRRN